MSAVELEPNFDELRYLTPWYDLVQRHGLGKAIDGLIIWQVLNGWDADVYPRFLVSVFGQAAAERAHAMQDNPTPLTGRFLIIEGEDYAGRVKTYCQRIIKEYQDWVLYDP